MANAHLILKQILRIHKVNAINTWRNRPWLVTHFVLCWRGLRDEVKNDAKPEYSFPKLSLPQYTAKYGAGEI